MAADVVVVGAMSSSDAMVAVVALAAEVNLIGVADMTDVVADDTNSDGTGYCCNACRWS